MTYNHKFKASMTKKNVENLSFLCDDDGNSQSVEGRFFRSLFQKKGCKSTELSVCVKSVTSSENSYHVLTKIHIMTLSFMLP